MIQCCIAFIFTFCHDFNYVIKVCLSISNALSASVSSNIAHPSVECHKHHTSEFPSTHKMDKLKIFWVFRMCEFNIHSNLIIIRTRIPQTLSNVVILNLHSIPPGVLISAITFGSLFLSLFTEIFEISRTESRIYIYVYNISLKLVIYMRNGFWWVMTACRVHT